MALDQRAAQFDLSLTVTEDGSELEASFEYNTDLLEPATIERMSEHFQILLESVVADPSLALAELSMQSPSERQQLLFGWNNTQVDPGPFAGVHELFERHAALTPDQTAVVSDGQTWSYRELNERANRLAHYLRARGVGPEVTVGISLPRSAAMLACVLGVLKAGGAYVPLDPSYPEERLAFMVRNSRALLVLTEELLESDASSIDAESEQNLSLAITAENLAYLIYTSGSTGTPKGVMVQHGSLSNYIVSASVAYDVVPGDRVLQFSSFSFDASVEEIFVCLAGGATLVLRGGEAPRTPAEFLEECREKKLTVLDLPTAYWHELVAQLTRDDWSTVSELRLVIIGGDKALPKRVERWHKDVGTRVRLVNTYGPTEATVVATMCDLAGPPAAQQAVSLGQQAVPIGRPVANTHAYVLDQQLRPVVAGARGHLYLGGANLSRGYLGDARLTAEKFVPNTFSQTPGARLYRTGDRARWRHDGQIEFLGRADQQVKIRGHRIEPAEIEAALLRHEKLRDAVVVTREEENGEQRLAAYVVSNDDGSTALLDSFGLRSFLAERLPQHLIPASFTVLASLPRLPSGKIDRRALPPPASGSISAAKSYVAPATHIEQVLCDLWAEVLKVDRVGMHDDFFALGGDSILSIQVAARARLAGLQLSSSQIFRHPTPAELAVVASPVRTYAGADPITGEINLTPIQRWYFEQEFSVPDRWNMSVMLKTRERLDAVLLDHAFASLLRHHDALRSHFGNTHDEWRQFIAGMRPQEKILRVVDLSGIAKDEHQSVLENIAGETQTQLDLASGDLLRAVLFDLGEDQPQRLLMAIHHLVVDGVSWRILLEDLGRAYRQLQRRDTVSLPPRTTSVARWAILLAEHARSEQIHNELSYWTAWSSERIQPLPVDFHDGSNIEAESRTLTIVLDSAETQSLLRTAGQGRGTHVNDVLVTALVQTIAHWTGEQGVLLELEGHGREELFDDVDLSRTVGWFTNAFPVLIETKAELSPVAALHSIKQQLRAIPNHGIGYGLLRYLNDDTELVHEMRRLPVPQISFNYLGQLDQMLDEADLFSFADESCGMTRHPTARRSQLLEINAHISKRQLQVDWNYSSGFH
ncbi:MAG TPA: amino acid adenylation domain-containing protein, partial [Pyrinomonadaceae bacterium]|nr:amino acid adenylation domain-containing protein [Pyrinomonadaceae bacterium]